MAKKDYFIGYKNTKKLSLCIILSKMGGYRKDFNETKYIPFLIKDDKNITKFGKESKISSKKFNSEPL